jgi:hypothetical protein
MSRQPSFSRTWRALGTAAVIALSIGHARSDSVVVFNEIHYHPAQTDDPEWIELTNLMSVNVDLSKWRIRGGVEFEFPEGTVIEAGGFLVISSKPTAEGIALGPWTGSLNNGGEQLRLRNNSRRLMNSVNFSDGGDWPEGPDGSGATLAKFDPNTASPDAANWTTSSEVGGTPGARNFALPGQKPMIETMMLFDWDAVWRYNETDDLPAGWDDSTHQAGGNWKSGPGPLGWDTWPPPVPFGTEVTRPSMNEEPVITHYFEREFDLTVEQAKTIVGLQLNYLIDDGAVIYLNGEEVFRHNMADEEVGPETLANARGEAELVEPVNVPATPMVAGTNRVSAEVHQNTAGSSDVAFGMTLGASFQPPGPSTDIGIPVFSEISAAGSDPFRAELTNVGTANLDLAGHSIVSSAGKRFDIPAQVLQPGAYLVLDTGKMGVTPVDGDRLFLLGSQGAAFADARRVTPRLRGRSLEHDGRWLYPSMSTFGEANTFSFHDEIVINEIMYHFREDPGSPGIPAITQDVEIVPIDAMWRFNESGADLGAGWAQNSHAVNNADWFQGAALLGAETTADKLPEPLVTEFANPSDNDFLTYYLETDFEIVAEQLDTLSDLKMRHVIDDGAVFYLNGAEILRFNMDDGEITAATTANDSVSNADYSDVVTIPADQLVVGTNRLSVELHQRSATSSDVIFGAELTATEFVRPATPAIPIMERDEEWVELFNKSESAVDLTGWGLRGGISFDFPEGTIIEAGAFAVVSNDAEALKAKLPGMAGRIYGDFQRQLRNSHDCVRLEDAAENLADEVIYYDGGRWPELADGDGSSLELRDPGADNSSPGAWAASDESGKMPWQTAAYRMDGDQEYGLTTFREFRLGMLRAGEVLLDDISVVRDPDGDAEQLIQNGTFETDPGDDTWRNLGNHRHSVAIPEPGNPGNMVLHLVAKGSTDTRHNHLETTFVDNTALNRSEIYEVSYRARWLAGSNQLNTRGYYQRIARTTPLERPEVCGTPGAPNSTLEGNIGPTFSNLKHEPAIPEENQPVTVSVNVNDPDGLAAIVLHAKVDGEEAESEVNLSPAGDDTYTGTLPGQSAGTVVQFWVEARDSLGAESMMPAAGPNSRALVQVEDGRGKDLPAQELRVIMLDDDSDFMHDRFNLMSNEQLGGTAIYNGLEVFYDVGVRLRGSGAGRARDGNDYRGFRVAFPSDHLFRGVHGSVGMDRSGRAPGAKRQDEIYVKHMFNRGGVPAMYDDLVFFIPPTRVHTGTSMMLLAAYGSVFTESQFENGQRGSIFNYDITYDPASSTGGREGLKPPVPFTHIGTDLRDLGDDKEQYRAPFEIRTGRRRDDYSGLINFLQVMDLPRAEVAAQIGEWMDVDEWMRYAALTILCGIGDTYIAGGLQHNIRLYVPEDGRGVAALPWDQDFVFTTSATATLNPGGGKFRNVFNVPRYKRLYWGHVQDLVNTTFNEEYMEPWLTHYGDVVGQRFTSQARYIRRRGEHALGQVPDEIEFSVAQGAGDFEVNATQAVLEGAGWVNIREFRLAGSDEALPAEWLDDEKWRVTVPLRSGPNIVTLETYDFQGALLDTHTVTITSLVETPTPPEFLRITEIHYNPAADSGNTEFIELRNIGTGALDVSGVTFTDGIAFTFPNPTILDGGSYLVAVEDKAAFEAHYGAGLPIAGEYAPGALNNGGETIELRDASGNVIHRFTYDDAWHTATDGGGPSLVVVDDMKPVADWNTAAQWSTSNVMHGTPGRGETVPTTQYPTWQSLYFTEAEIANPDISGPGADPNGDGTTNLLKYAFGLDPRKPNPPGSMPAASIGDGHLQVTVRRQKNVPDLQFEMQLSDDLITWDTSTAVAGPATDNGDGTETITFQDPALLGANRQRFARVSVTLSQ